jgi:acetyl esterase/lipase
MVSLEKHVGIHTPKTFIWSTFADDNVPAENSLLWVQAMMQHKIPVEYHMYEKGRHGLSLASELTDNQDHTCIQEECQSWVDLAETWLQNLIK